MTRKEKAINNLSVSGNNTSTTNPNLSKEPDASESRGDDDIDFEGASTSTPKSDYITISLPRKKMLRETAELSARLGLSAIKEMARTAKLIKLGG